MRRLLVKLVAIETALLGWLSYWLFLVYANNPSVTDQLVNNLQRLPQLSFSTIDISVLVIIAALSIIIAFKFHRGLKPGIRLERALQMLENLMKRNLLLEAQVQELKVDKVQTTASPTLASTNPSENRSGSWEKAFRTPLEAGPPLTTSSRVSQDIPFENETGMPPPRIEMKTQGPSPNVKPPIIISDKLLEKPMKVPLPTPKPTEKTLESPSTSSSWEDSPKFAGESKRILTPSAPPRRFPPISESSGLRQPYIPAPATKSIPPSVIVGAMNSTPLPVRPFPRPPTTPQASPRNAPSFFRSQIGQTKPIEPSPSKTETAPTTVTNKPASVEAPTEPEKSVEIKSTESKPQEEEKLETEQDKESSKPTSKRKFPYQEN